MFSKVLIANRGEVALRVIRACRELGVKPVSIYSDADSESLHIKMSDECVRIGGLRPEESYLNIELVVEAAQKLGVDAVHPGYGFLSENALFAERLEDASICFIGPSSQTLTLTGDKVKCRDAINAAGVPVLPGSDGIVADAADVVEVGREIGWPLLLKAAFGGGGRGIRLVKDREEIEEAFRSASAEAKAGFGDGALYVEKFLRNPRHIEFQILRDREGKCVHLGERECSIQRRYQKIIEMSPSPLMSEEMRATVGRLAVKVAEALGYLNAGTVEFVVDDSGKFYCTEVNARLQVEHAVTEMVTRVDLVKQQLRLASGELLDGDMQRVKLNGCALECRIYAEDPFRGFMPTSGSVIKYSTPNSSYARIESALYEGYRVPEFYDPLVSKVITWGYDLSDAIAQMQLALSEYRIEGIHTNIPLLKVILSDLEFQAGKIHTRFIEERNLIERTIDAEREKRSLAAEAACIAFALKSHVFLEVKQPKATVRAAPWRSPALNPAATGRFTDGY